MRILNLILSRAKPWIGYCFEGGDKIPDTFNRIRIAPFGESTRNSEHLIEITLSQEGYIYMVIPEGYTISRLVGGEIKLIPNSNK
jgi:hypothetical protein